MQPIVHLVRNAKGVHNVEDRWNLRDPDLTKYDPRDPSSYNNGERQCDEFSENNCVSQDRITHVVSSPSYRCVRTAIMVFDEVVRRRELVRINPDIQGKADDQCNIPLDIDELRDKADEWIDTALLKNVNYTDRGPDSPFRCDEACVVERARKGRVWLRELAREYNKETREHAELGVVSHGDFLKYLTKDDDDLEWANCQMRSYRFVDLNGNDDQAYLELDRGAKRVTWDKVLEKF